MVASEYPDKSTGDAVRTFYSKSEQAAKRGHMGDSKTQRPFDLPAGLGYTECTTPVPGASGEYLKLTLA